MNSRAIPGAYLFHLYVCDKEMSCPPTRPGCLRSRQREVRRLIITFRLTNVIPERIIFVNRGITVLYIVSNIFPTTLHTHFLPQSFASHHFTTHIYPSHYTPLSPLPYAALHYPSLHFTSLHFFTLLGDFHFTSFHYTTL